MQSRAGTAILRCRAGQARCRKAKTAPLCKGSCRRTPTEGLTASRRTQAVLPHPTIENQLNHSPGFAIPPAWRCHAVPPLHKGGFSLPCGIGPGLHPGFFRQSRSTRAEQRIKPGRAWEWRLATQDCTQAFSGKAGASRPATHTAGESMTAGAPRRMFRDYKLMIENRNKV